MPLSYNDDEGTLTIGGISMNPTNGAWGVLGDAKGEGGLIQLWIEAEVRGQDRILPSVTGVIPYQRRITVSPFSLNLYVVGDVNGQTSAPVADTRVGLAANLEYLRANVWAPVVSSSGTRAATLTVFGQTLRTANIHVLGVKTTEYLIQECGSIWVGKLNISIPAGRFT